MTTSEAPDTTLTDLYLRLSDLRAEDLENGSLGFKERQRTSVK